MTKIIDGWSVLSCATYALPIGAAVRKKVGEMKRLVAFLLCPTGALDLRGQLSQFSYQHPDGSISRLANRAR